MKYILSILRHFVQCRTILCQRLLGEEDLPIPKRAKEGDAGFDLYCAVDKTLQPQEEAMICQGIRCKVPHGSVGMIFPRSSANKIGLHVKIGTIDSGYTGRMFAMVVNHSNKPIQIHRGDRICQLVPLKLYDVCDEMFEVSEMPNTKRGNTGFGSTGDAAYHSSPI